MREAIQTVLATNRPLSLNPSEARAVVQTLAAGEIRIALAAGAQAVLRPSPLQGASARGQSRLVGAIRSRHGWVSVPVEIGTAPASESCAELVVRPVGPVCLRSEAHRRLFNRTSHVLADFFSTEIELVGLTIAPTPVATPAEPTRHHAVTLPA
ncbi:MAG: hypothetical protein ACRDZ3_19830 [Acidimicrobiia bacterium]